MLGNRISSEIQSNLRIEDVVLLLMMRTPNIGWAGARRPALRGHPHIPSSRAPSLTMLLLRGSDSPAEPPSWPAEPTSRVEVRKSRWLAFLPAPPTLQVRLRQVAASSQSLPGIFWEGFPPCPPPLCLEPFPVRGPCVERQQPGCDQGGRPRERRGAAQSVPRH